MRKGKKALMGIAAVLFMVVCCFLEHIIYKNTDVINQNQPEVSVISDAVLENQEEVKKKEQKVAYLTFDDGPSVVTERVLDVLKAYEINATFFLIGSNLTEEQEPLVKRMVEEGNTVGIHTYCHEADCMYGSFENYKADFCKAEKRVQEVTGVKSTLCRFPWGSANAYLVGMKKQVVSWLETKGYAYCDWNVSAEDSVGTPTACSIMKNIKKDYERYNQPVILMHDSSTNALTAELLPDIIVMLKDRGYQFDTLDHMETPYQYPMN